MRSVPCLNRHLLQLLVILAVFMTATSASAGIYRWVDENGQVKYGDRPPADVSNSDEVVIRNQVPASEPAKVDRKQMQQRYLEQLQNERAERKEKAAKKRKEKAQREKRCIYARNALKEYQESGVLYERLPNSERRYLTDQEREQEISKARRDVDRWCK